MKILSWFQVTALAISLCLPAGLGFAQQPQQQDDFKIVGVRTFTSNDLIKVGAAWRKDLPRRIQATLRVDADTPASGIFVKAYFYDHDNQLVGSYPRPNNIWTSTGKGIEEVGLPATLLRTKNTDVYFAIPEDLQTKKWATVLVVFGNPSKVATSANPATAISKLDFPEKALWSPTP